jgi:hypothetical protein
MAMARTVATLLTVLVLLAGGLAPAAPPDAANWAQVDAGYWHCDAPSPYDGFVDYPMLHLSLTTEGGPVELALTATGAMNTVGGFFLDPLIDGVQDSDHRLWHQASGVDVQGSLHFSRIYALPPGGHTFGWRVACQGSVGFARAWMSATELTIGKK